MAEEIASVAFNRMLITDTFEYLPKTPPSYKCAARRNPRWRVFRGQTDSRGQGARPQENVFRGSFCKDALYF